MAYKIMNYGKVIEAKYINIISEPYKKLINGI